jgi:hypothetical protein
VQPLDRKEQSRLYKESAQPMGVFRVRNVAAAISLVGTSANLPAMLNRQRFQLQMGSHPNRALQDDFNELGQGAFAFETLDVLEPAEDPETDPEPDLAELELMWRERFSAAGEAVYNERPGRLT